MLMKEIPNANFNGHSIYQKEKKKKRFKKNLKEISKIKFQK